MRPGHPGPDRADGYPLHLGGLLVRQADDLGEHERAAPVVGQRAQQRRGGQRAGLIGYRGRDGLGGQPRVEAAQSGQGPDVVGAGPPGDAEQPGTRRGAARESRGAPGTPAGTCPG